MIVLLSACGGGSLRGSLPEGASAYTVIPAAASDGVSPDYRIGPLDSIDVNVFLEQDLSVKSARVDAAGNIALPLVGTVTAAGKTAGELATELERRYGEKYLKGPQVSVVVAASVSQKVVVQGQVAQPGVYEIKGPTTLLQAISLARGETPVADVKQVAVFRTMSGQRMGAIFDVEVIRRGEALDPAVIGNDVVIVGYSGPKGFWRDVLSTSPLLNIFRPVF